MALLHIYACLTYSTNPAVVVFGSVLVRAVVVVLFTVRRLILYSPAFSPSVCSTLYLTTFLVE